MRLKIQLVIAFILLSAALIIPTLTFLFHQQKKVQLKFTESYLSSVNTSKVNRLNNIIEKKVELGKVLANSLRVQSGTASILKSPTPTTKTQFINSLSQFNTTINSIHSIYIIDTTGFTLVSTDQSKGKYFSNVDKFKALAPEKYLIDSFNYENGILTLDMYLPIVVNNRKIGIFLATFLANDILNLTMDYAGLGTTGETTIATQINDNIILFLNPLRHKGSQMIPNNPGEFVMAKALNENRSGITTGLDYRRHKVIAAYSYLPEFKWGLVTKVDIEEILNPYRTMKKDFYQLILMASPFALVLAYLLASLFYRPVKKLIQNTRRIQNGDLSHRIKRIPNNELGELAQSFNEMSDRLEKKIKELDHFAYVASHDLKAPVVSILPLLKMVKEEYNNKPLDHEGLKMLEMAEFKAQGMLEMITGILASAKNLEKVKEEINTNELVTRIVNNLNIPHNINIQIEKNLPIIKYDKISFIQIFQNLLGNAIKYSDKSIGEIKVFSDESAKVYIFGISDNGPGVKEEEKDKIFQYLETGSAIPNESRTGIGLSVVKSNVEKNGGEIWLESNPEIGSTFFFSVPKK